MALAADLISDNTIPIAKAKDSLKRIKSPSAFAKVALESDRETLGQDACLLIKDEHILHQLLNTREVTNTCTLHALHFIHDSSLLTQLLLSQRINGNGLSSYHGFMRKIKDMTVLEQIAKQYPYESIRFNAQSTLVSLQLEQKLKKVSETNDDNELMRIVLEETDWSVWHSAIEKISSQDILYQIAIKQKHHGFANHAIKDAAIERITDQALLAAISVQQKSLLKGNQAFKKLTDETQLYEVARAGIDPAARLSTMATAEVREAATQRIFNESMLIKIAVNDPDSKVRAAALGEIHDQPLLIAVATQSPDEWERSVAISKLLDPSILKALTNKSKTQTAIANLQLALLEVDPEGAISEIQLEQILISQEYTRMMASSYRLDGEKVTITIKNRSTGERFPITTKTVFPNKTMTSRNRESSRSIRPALLTDQNLVSPLSQYLFSLSPRPDMGNLVTTKSSDLLRAAALVNVARKQIVESFYNDPSLLVRTVAVERLTNQSLLEQLAQNEENVAIRSSAVHKIDNTDLLYRLSNDKTADSSVSRAAQLRLKVLELLK
jgi:hypothetical protein